MCMYHIHVYAHKHIHAYTCIFVYLCVCVCTDTYIQTKIILPTFFGLFLSNEACVRWQSRCVCFLVSTGFFHFLFEDVCMWLCA